MSLRAPVDERFLRIVVIFISNIKHSHCCTDIKVNIMTINKLVTKATYSPEDNKLRLHLVEGDERFDTDTYQILKDNGFKYAPVQRLFVAPRWTPAREDVCVMLAGEIVSEDSTMLERATAKAERLEALSEKRKSESSAFQDAAKRNLDRMEMGQPILIGHHSERKHRKALESSERNMDKAVAALKAANYWSYRSEGVQHHANRKNDAGVRGRRIQTLLKELRDHQRDINHGHVVFDLWDKISGIENSEVRNSYVQRYVGARLATGSATPYSYYKALNAGELTEEQVIKDAKTWAINIVTNIGSSRCITHVLNRLAYERFMLGSVSRYTGKLSATIIKAFARENGALKPDCKNVDGQWELSSGVPLPLHIAEGETLSLSDEEWRDLMESCGYNVPVKAPAKPPILNFEADSIDVSIHRSNKTLRQIKLTKAEYKEIHSDFRGVKLSSCGGFRVKVALDPNQGGAYWSRDWVCVCLSDSKKHEIPTSESIKAFNAVDGLEKTAEV